MSPVQQRLGQGHPSALAGRQVAGAPIEELLEVEVARQFGDALLQVAHAVKPAVDPEVLGDGEPPRQIDVRRGEVHPTQRTIAVAQHVDAHHLDRARRRHQQTEQDRDRGRLASAVAAQQGGGRSRLHRKVDAVDRGNVVEALDQIGDDDRRAHRRIIRRGNRVKRSMFGSTGRQRSAPSQEVSVETFRKDPQGVVGHDARHGSLSRNTSPQPSRQRKWREASG